MARIYTVSSSSESFSSESAAAEAVRTANGWAAVAVTAPEQVEPGVFAVWAYPSDTAMDADQTGAGGERIEIRA